MFGYVVRLRKYMKGISNFYLEAVMTKDVIISESHKAFTGLLEYLHSLPDDVFYYHPPQKWSPAQHLHHLTICTRSATAAYALPKWIVRLIGGKPGSPIDYDTLVERYQKILREGGKASGRYVPREIAPESGKIKWQIKWEQATRLYLDALESRWTDTELDKYAVGHPLLGKISLRELCFFTLYHTIHHWEIVRSLSNYR